MAQKEAAGIVLTLGLVTATSASLLRIADAFPSWLRGEPARVQAFHDLAETERELGAPLLLPTYFPDTLGCPPDSIRVRGRRPATVALVFLRKDGGRPVLFVQTVGGDHPIAPVLLPAGIAIHAVSLTVGSAPARLLRVVVRGGEAWSDLVLARERRQIVFRFDGRTEEVIRMAESLRRRRP